MVDNNINIKGITVNNHTHKITQLPMILQCFLMVVMGRLDQRSINRRRYGTIAFGH